MEDARCSTPTPPIPLLLQKHLNDVSGRVRWQPGGLDGFDMYCCNQTMRHMAPFLWAMLPVIFSVSHRSIFRNQGLFEATISHPEGKYAEIRYKQRFVVACLLQY